MVSINPTDNFILTLSDLRRLGRQGGATLLSHDLALPLLREEVNRLSTVLNCFQVPVDEA